MGSDSKTNTMLIMVVIVLLMVVIGCVGCIFTGIVGAVIGHMMTNRSKDVDSGYKKMHPINDEI